MTKIQRLSQSEFKEVSSLSQFAFQYRLSEEEFIKKNEEAKRHIIWGWKEDGELAAKLHLIPLACYVNGKNMDMGGIAGVATWPEYRRKGMVKHLLYHALKHMKDHGQLLSFLHPFSFPFYRKFGWEYTFAKKHYSLPVESLKATWETEGYVRRTDANISLLDKVYTEYAKNYNGMLLRDEKWWKQRVLKDNTTTIAVAYNNDSNAIGYVIYSVKNNVLTAEEMVYTNQNGLHLLLEFIGNHDSMAKTVELDVPENDLLPLLINDPRFDQKVIPYFMARIVDVQGFLQAFPYNTNLKDSTPLGITVTDTFFPDNSGTYYLQPSGNTINVNMEHSRDTQETIHCTIQILTGMFLGFKRPLEYYHAGLVQGELTSIEKLEMLIPKRQTYLADFF